MTLRLGCITYSNCVPFFYFIREAGFDGEIIPGVPAELNRLLASGAIDASPSSSFEYARNWRNYLLLPDLSVSADGPVWSVLLFSEKSPEQLDPLTKIAITGESATSVNLLRVILREYYGWDHVCTYVPGEPLEQIVASGRPVLLIGDRALRCAYTTNHRAFDLGTMWKELTALPFVFALWIVRREFAEKNAVALDLLKKQLQQAKEKAFSQLSLLARRTGEATAMTEKQRVEYWRLIEYGLPASCLEGMQLYFQLAAKYQLLDDVPEIRFAR
ncbi:MAG: menaquinone biosynthesis protein [Desulfuromonadales bacterium]|nr:menaquinone biosynthesis protein [Desulfuromonadales bacterium]